MEFFEDFVCVLQTVLGLKSKHRKSSMDKANISNPKVNRGCASLTVNRTSADCVQISLGPTISYIPLGVYHTGGFNAMGPGEFPTQRPVTRSFDVFFDLRLNKRLSKRGHYDVNVMLRWLATRCQSLANMSTDISGFEKPLIKFNVSELDKRYSVESLTFIRKVDEKNIIVAKLFLREWPRKVQVLCAQHGTKCKKNRKTSLVRLL